MTTVYVLSGDNGGDQHYHVIGVYATQQLAERAEKSFVDAELIGLEENGFDSSYMSSYTIVAAPVVDREDL